MGAELFDSHLMPSPVFNQEASFKKTGTLRLTLRRQNKIKVFGGWRDLLVSG